jgi:hypothetical protein
MLVLMLRFEPQLAEILYEWPVDVDACGEREMRLPMLLYDASLSIGDCWSGACPRPVGVNEAKEDRRWWERRERAGCGRLGESAVRTQNAARGPRPWIQRVRARAPKTIRAQDEVSVDELDEDRKRMTKGC